MDFVKDSHAETFVTRRVEGTLMNILISAKRSYYPDFVGKFDGNSRDSDSERREEDDIIDDEEISICDSTRSFKEKVTLQMAKIKAASFLSPYLPASPLESNVMRKFYAYAGQNAAKLIDWGLPDSDLWDSVVISDFADKSSMCHMRESAAFKQLNEANLRDGFESVVTFLLEEFVPQRAKRKKNTPF